MACRSASAWWRSAGCGGYGLYGLCGGSFGMWGHMVEVGYAAVAWW